MYCTLQDLINKEPEAKLIQLTDDAHSGAVNMAVIDAAIGEADSLVNSILRGHVDLPLAVPVEPIIQQISVQLTLYNLYYRKFKANMPEPITVQRNWADTKLREIAAGKIIITEKQRTEEPATQIRFSKPRQRFGEGTIASYERGTLPGNSDTDAFSGY